MGDERRAILIANPQAGRNRARRAEEIERFCRILRAGGVEVEATYTNAPGEGERLARRAAGEGTRLVIVSGGDGTINEALQGLAGTSARLAVWPRGTANVLAREINMPSQPERAAEVIIGGKSKLIYPGCALTEETGERRYFFLMAGIGLDASIVERVKPGLKRRLGKAAFWYSGLEHLANWRPEPFEVEVCGETFPATFAAIGKGSRYGGDLAITPRARLEEPGFEICLINSHSRLRYLHLLSRAMRSDGVAYESSDVRFIRTTRARVRGSVAVQVDGELIGRTPMSFEIAHSPVKIVIP